MKAKRHRARTRDRNGRFRPRRLAKRRRDRNGGMGFFSDRSWAPGRRLFAPLLAAFLVGNAAGCHLVGWSSSGNTPPVSSEVVSTPVPDGPFDGFLEIEGGRINGVLTVTPSGGNQLEGFFESAPDLVAIGRGRMRGQELWMELSYEGSCPGRMELEGKWDPASGEISGSVRASDCTGVAKGTFLFLRY